MLSGVVVDISDAHQLDNGRIRNERKAVRIVETGNNRRYDSRFWIDLHQFVFIRTADISYVRIQVLGVQPGHVNGYDGHYRLGWRYRTFPSGRLA